MWSDGKHGEKHAPEKGEVGVIEENVEYPESEHYYTQGDLQNERNEDIDSDEAVNAGFIPFESKYLHECSISMRTLLIEEKKVFENGINSLDSHHNIS